MTTFDCNDCVFDSCDNCIYRVRPITAQEDARIRGIPECQGCQMPQPCGMSEEEDDDRQRSIIEGQKRRATAKERGLVDSRIFRFAPSGKRAKDVQEHCGTCAHWRELSDEGTGRCFVPLPDSLIDNGTRVMGYWNGLECPCWKEKP